MACQANLCTHMDMAVLRSILTCIKEVNGTSSNGTMGFGCTIVSSLERHKICGRKEPKQQKPYSAGRQMQPSYADNIVNKLKD